MSIQTWYLKLARCLFHYLLNVSKIVLFENKFTLSATTNPSLVFLNHLIWSMILSTIQQKLIVQKFLLLRLSLNIFHNKTIEYLWCKLLLNCDQFHNDLKNSRSFNRPKSNEICLTFRFCSCSQYLKEFFLQKRFLFGFITKKKFPHIFLFRASTKVFITWE